MRNLFALVLLTFIMCTASCVPLKDITYLRENEQRQDSLVTLQAQPPPYRLQVGDILSIRLKALDQQLVEFFNPSNGSGTSLDEGFYYDGFAVDNHGNIRVPELGEINVLGRTTEEIREIIEKRLLEDYIKDEADLFVTVKLPGIRYTLVGEIGSSGTQNVLAEKVSILEAIANAGGVPLTGDLTDVIIIRQYPGGQRIHHIDLTTIDVMQSPFYYIQPNDIITVNPRPQKALGIGTTGLDTFRTILTVVTTFTTVILLATRL